MRIIIFVCLVIICQQLSAQQSIRITDRPQRWKELNLTDAQKEQVRLLLIRQYIQKKIDRATLNTILTREQIKKIHRWKKLKSKSR